MAVDLRHLFGTLDMCFEPIENAPMSYRVCSVWSGLPHRLTNGQEITFQSTDPHLPLPNREHLHIRVACCRVAHLSGATVLFNELEEDMESDPHPRTDAPEFARALQPHLEYLSYC